jgi:hypothetical protein
MSIEIGTAGYCGPILTTAHSTSLTDTFLAEYERRIVRRAQYEVLKAAGTYLLDVEVTALAEEFGLPWPLHSGGIVSDVAGLGQDPMERS